MSRLSCFRGYSGMLVRGSVLLSAVLVACASVIGVTIIVSSAGAASPHEVRSEQSPGLPSPDGLGRGDLMGSGVPQSTVEQRVALFKARLEEWAPPSRTNRVRRASIAWHASSVRSPPASGAALDASWALLSATSVGSGRESLDSLRASGDQHCLATAIYYEARSQSLEGQEAVAQVIMNRVGKSQFADSVCGVVAQGGERHGCQFSFVCDGSMRRPPRNAVAWATAEDVAARTLRGTVASRVGAATFYHANYVSPWWSKVLPRVAQIGAHIFYDGLDSAVSSALRSVSPLERPIAPPLVGTSVARAHDEPLLPGGLLAGA
jgi:hypothetical protein